MQFEGFLITHATRSSSCGSWSHKQATFESLHVCRVLGTQGTINVGIGRHICWRSACAAHVWEIKEMQKCCLFPLVGPWCHSISMHCSCIPSSSIRMPSACSFNLFSQSLPCETMVGCQPEDGWRARAGAAWAGQGRRGFNYHDMRLDTTYTQAAIHG